MTNETKKIIAAFLAGGALSGGSAVAIDRSNCDAAVLYQGEELCITEEVKEAISSQLQPNNGFGGVNFGG